MTVVNPKSISGINSITMASGSDDLLTIHSNNTTERVRVNNSGDVIIGSGVTLSPDGDVFATGITTVSGNVKVGTGITLSPDGDVFFTGIITGNGSGLTNLATDLVNDTSPQLGGDLDTNTKNIKFGDSASHGASGDDTLIFGADDDMRIYHDGSNGFISNNTGAFVIQDSHAGANAVIIRKGAEVELLHNNVLACETSANGLAFPSGKGIDFSATSDAGGMTSELLDDYEEGTFTASLANVNAPTYEAQGGTYTKIGRVVHGTITIGVASGLDTTDGSAVNITGLPFTGQGESCVVTLGRYTNLLGGKSTAFRNVRFGGTYIILCENSNATIDYNEINSSGYLQLSFTYHTS